MANTPKKKKKVATKKRKTLSLSRKSNPKRKAQRRDSDQPFYPEVEIASSVGKRRKTSKSPENEEMETSSQEINKKKGHMELLPLLKDIDFSFTAEEQIVKDDIGIAQYRNRVIPLIKQHPKHNFELYMEDAKQYEIECDTKFKNMKDENVITKKRTKPPYEYTTYRYELVKEYFSLEKQANETVRKQLKMERLKAISNHPGKTVGVFRVTDDGILQRKQTYKKPGTSEEGERFYDIQICTDVKVYNIINDLHWNVKGNTHQGKDKLREYLQYEYGTSISERMIKWVISNCMVCRIKRWKRYEIENNHLLMKKDINELKLTDEASESALKSALNSREDVDHPLIATDPLNVNKTGETLPFVLIRNSLIGDTSLIRLTDRSIESYANCVIDYICSNGEKDVSVSIEDNFVKRFFCDGDIQQAYKAIYKVFKNVFQCDLKERSMTENAVSIQIFLPLQKKLQQMKNPKEIQLIRKAILSHNNQKRLLIRDAMLSQYNKHKRQTNPPESVSQNSTFVSKRSEVNTNPMERNISIEKITSPEIHAMNDPTDINSPGINDDKDDKLSSLDIDIPGKAFTNSIVDSIVTSIPDKEKLSITIKFLRRVFQEDQDKEETIETAGATILIPVENHGMQCYALAVHHLLSVIPQFKLGLVESFQMDDNIVSTVNEKCLAFGTILLLSNQFQLQKIIKAGKKQLKKKYLTYHIFRRLRDKKLEQFDNEKQMDSSEYLLQYINQLSVEVPKIEDNLSLEYIDTHTCKDCKFERTRHNTTHILWVNFRGNNQENSIQTMLDYTVGKESNFSTALCESCNKRTEREIQNNIICCSQYILIGIRRFHYEFGTSIKNQSSVQLDYAVEISIDGKSRKLYLHGVICHIGPTPVVGHNNCFLLERPSGQENLIFHVVDDEKTKIVSQKDFETFCATHSYLLLYGWDLPGSLENIYKNERSFLSNHNQLIFNILRRKSERTRGKSGYNRNRKSIYTISNKDENIDDLTIGQLERKSNISTNKRQSNVDSTNSGNKVGNMEEISGGTLKKSNKDQTTLHLKNTTNTKSKTSIESISSESIEANTNSGVTPSNVEVNSGGTSLKNQCNQTSSEESIDNSADENTSSCEVVDNDNDEVGPVINKSAGGNANSGEVEHNDNKEVDPVIDKSADGSANSGEVVDNDNDEVGPVIDSGKDIDMESGQENDGEVAGALNDKNMDASSTETSKNVNTDNNDTSSSESKMNEDDDDSSDDEVGKLIEEAKSMQSNTEQYVSSENSTDTNLSDYEDDYIPEALTGKESTTEMSEILKRNAEKKQMKEMRDLKKLKEQQKKRGGFCCGCNRAIKGRKNIVSYQRGEHCLELCLTCNNTIPNSSDLKRMIETSSNENCLVCKKLLNAEYHSLAFCGICRDCVWDNNCFCTGCWFPKRTINIPLLHVWKKFIADHNEKPSVTEFFKRAHHHKVETNWVDELEILVGEERESKKVAVSMDRHKITYADLYELIHPSRTHYYISTRVFNASIMLLQRSKVRHETSECTFICPPIYSNTDVHKLINSPEVKSHERIFFTAYYEEFECWTALLFIKDEEDGTTIFRFDTLDAMTAVSNKFYEKMSDIICEVDTTSEIFPDPWKDDGWLPGPFPRNELGKYRVMTKYDSAVICLFFAWQVQREVEYTCSYFNTARMTKLLLFCLLTLDERYGQYKDVTKGFEEIYERDFDKEEDGCI